MTSDICKYCRKPVELGRFGSGVGSEPKLVHSEDKKQVHTEPFTHYATEATPEEAAHKPLKNIHPETLPIGAVIGAAKYDLNYEELYIHREYDGVTYWEDLFSGCGHCEDHEVIADIGRQNLEKDRQGNITTDKTSAEYFPDFKVIAVPPGFDFEMFSLHGNLRLINDIWVHEDGTNIHSCKGFNCDA